MDSDNYTIKQLKEGTHELALNICNLISEFEDTFDLRIGLNIERDQDTNDVIDLTIPLIDEKVYG